MVNFTNFFTFSPKPKHPRVKPDLHIDTNKLNRYDSGRRSTSSGHSSKMGDYKAWFFKQLNIASPATPPLSPRSSRSRSTTRSTATTTTTTTRSYRLTPYPSASSSDIDMNESQPCIIPKTMTARLCDYGECYKSLGQGSTATISIVRSKATQDGKSNQLYAVKKFRKPSRFETEKAYLKRLSAEFCISSTFNHPNVIETIDLVLDEHNNYCTVMEFCSGGDLFSAIMSEHMTEVEISCCFKQLMQGLAYLHSIGVAHRDIKPENLLLTSHGVLKIGDFGVSDVFQYAWESKPKKLTGVLGSEPYMAPEVLNQFKGYYGNKADVWSAGITLYSMWYNGFAWTRADTHANQEYKKFVKDWPTRSSRDFKAFPPHIRNLIYQMLDPNPDTRLSAEEVLQDPWVKSIHVCFNGVDGLQREHKHCKSRN